MDKQLYQEAVGSGTKLNWMGVLDWQHVRKGRVIARGQDRNALTLEGANFMLGVFFNAVAAPAQTAWYGRLYTVTPTTALTGAGAATNELAGTSYTGQQVTTWTLSQSTNWRVTTNQLTFTAGGAWPGATAIAFINAASGAGTKALSFIALSQTRTLAASDSLQATYYIQLS